MNVYYLSVQFLGKLLIYSFSDNKTCVNHFISHFTKQWNAPGRIHNRQGSRYMFQLNGSQWKFVKGFPPANCLSRILTVRFATIEKQAPYFFPFTEQNKNIIPWFPTSFTQLPLLMFTQLNLLGFQRGSEMWLQKNKKENSSAGSAKQRKRGIQEREILQ